ncbi:hypothetical protein H0H87_007779 [Tephrocybe sp. NHM501043]|nr:hypothetical protein H0H87_007779 [Tephrocybe sp. NHM501043]
MKSHSVGHAESQRLVLIIGDGLRADLLFNEDAFPTIKDAPKVVAPYLKSIAATRGAFGISHTRVPTESRPGHVAVIGGMYEDVSAVTKAREQPTRSKSLGLTTPNRDGKPTHHTFSFGSPDILPMFARGATPGKVKTWSYTQEDEDFTKDATHLDVWVLDQLKALLQNATSDATLDAQLRSGKVVFFLHLLGLDTTGHSYRPHSREYMNNIRVVDSIVQQTETLINEFYNDQETSFIFTADHGMSVIGNHGDGDPDNTRTPLVAWGRGIRGPLPDSTPSSHDSYSSPWGLSSLFRRDVEQADLAALMASLLGIDWPVNSVGVLPDVDPTRPGYLSPRSGDKFLGEAAFVNAKARTLFYKPFAPLEGLEALKNEPHRIASLTRIEDLIRNGDWRDARLTSADLIRTGLSGLHYLQRYERLLIRGIVIAAYIGWAAYASLYIFRPLVSGGLRKATIYVDTIAAAVLVGFWALFALQHAPWTFYVLSGGSLVLVCGGAAVLWVLIDARRQKGEASRQFLKNFFAIQFLVYFLGFGPCFVILSISVEGLFYVVYSLVLITWVSMESIVRNGEVWPTVTESKRAKVYQFRPDDIRIALFFLFFVQVGFFGTGK